MDLSDLGYEQPFMKLAGGDDPISVFLPVAIRRLRHPGNVADAIYREPFGLLLVDEAVEHHSFGSLTHPCHSSQ
jgi:hypothetical protein